MALQKNRRGSILLPSGETITLKEQKAFKSAVNAANQYRKREIAKYEGEGAQIYRDFGKTSDTLVQKRSASYTKMVEGKRVARFETKQQFLNALERAKSTVPAVNERARIYKENTIRAINTAYGDTKLTRKIKNEIRKMSGKEFVRKVDSGQLEGVEFVYYDPENSKLIKMANQLGINIGSGLPNPTAKNRRKV